MSLPYWSDLINYAAKEITEVFKENFIIHFVDGTQKEIDGIKDKKDKVVLKGDYAEIIDCHLSFSVPSSLCLKKETIKYISYENTNYIICQNLEQKEGFTKLYLKRSNNHGAQKN